MSEKYINEQINLSEKELISLCLIAHEKDITLNQLVNEILRKYIIEQST
jgi:hypothetical protein